LGFKNISQEDSCQNPSSKSPGWRIFLQGK